MNHSIFRNRAKAATIVYNELITMIYQTTIQITTERGFIDITQKLQECVKQSKISTGVVHAFLKHTSASLIITENSDSTVKGDLEEWFLARIPEDDNYAHNEEGPDDMPSHIRSVLTGVSLSIPITSGQLALGIWQAVNIWEHRNEPSPRTIVVTITGE